MTNRDREKQWRDFVFTVDVIVAAALAKDDLRSLQAPGAQLFQFRLLAASASETPRFPTGGWRDEQQLLSVTVAEGAGELRMTFQAVGYAALLRAADRGARILNADGDIDVSFRFDSQACGIVVLADTPGVRRAMTNFVVIFE